MTHKFDYNDITAKYLILIGVMIGCDEVEEVKYMSTYLVPSNFKAIQTLLLYRATFGGLSPFLTVLSTEEVVNISSVSI